LLFNISFHVVVTRIPLCHPTDPCTRSVFQSAYEYEFHSGYLLRSEYPMPVNKQDVAAAGIPMASQTDTALKL